MTSLPVNPHAQIHRFSHAGDIIRPLLFQAHRSIFRQQFEREIYVIHFDVYKSEQLHYVGKKYNTHKILTNGSLGMMR